MKNKRWNFFDVLIILVVLGVIAGIVFREQVKNTFFKNDTVDIYVTVSVTSVSNEAIPYLVDGKALYIKDTAFGNIYETSFVPVTEKVIVGSEEVTAQSSNYSSAVIVIRINGFVKDGKIFTKDGKQLLIKDELVLENEVVRFNCKITSLEKQ